jgi:hypothetical protein
MWPAGLKGGGGQVAGEGQRGAGEEAPRWPPTIGLQPEGRRLCRWGWVRM